MGRKGQKQRPFAFVRHIWHLKCQCSSTSQPCCVGSQRRCFTSTQNNLELPLAQYISTVSSWRVQRIFWASIEANMGQVQSAIAHQPCSPGPIALCSRPGSRAGPTGVKSCRRVFTKAHQAMGPAQGFSSWAEQLDRLGCLGKK